MNADTVQVQEQVERILRSPEFASSRQLREFLLYICTRAMEGATHLDQVEIAAAVLGKSSDFNPIDNASVRKLATVTRRRLEHYYSGPGARDPVVIDLPVRSYLPQFLVRPAGAEPEQQPVPPPPLTLPSPAPGEEQPPSRFRFPAAKWILAAAVAAIAFLLIAWLRSPGQPAVRPLRFQTQRGDIHGPGMDAARSAIRLGPLIGERDQVTVRMRFTPEQDTHQAGLMIWQDADNFVKLGRRFTARSLLDFAYEHRAQYEPAARELVYDPAGQLGIPVWLSLKREGRTITAFISRDGIAWRTLDAVTLPWDLKQPRAALYGFNGRRDARPAAVEFAGFSRGPIFEHWRNEAGDLSLPSGYQWDGECGEISRGWGEFGLLLALRAPTAHCSEILARPVEGENWVYSAQVDFLPAGGLSAGITVRGTKGIVRLVRYQADRPAVVVIHDGHSFTPLADFPGSPPLELRLIARRGELRGSFSRDGVAFTDLPFRLPLERLGGKLRAGIVFSTSPWGSTGTSHAAGFRHFHEDILDLQPLP